MSIKSQKSLNEECSEIWEKSYSVRSGSDEDLSSHSSEDETDHLARVLLCAMTPAVLSKLRRCFHKGPPRTLKDVARRVEKVMLAAAASEGVTFAAGEPRAHCLWIDEPTFIKSLEHIFGHHKYSVHAHKLYQTLDPFCTHRVSWDSLLDRLVAVGARRTRSRADVWKNISEGKMKQMGHCMRETIVKLVSICTEDSFCFAAVSRGGRVGLYDGELRMLHQYQLWYHRKGISRRVKNCWVTDAIYMPDALSLCIAASDRSLTIYDASTLGHAPLYCITSLTNIPTCLTYEPSPSPHSPSELVFGDERGDVTRLSLLQPRVALLHKKHADRINCYFWMELTSPPHNTYCSVTHWPRVHTRSVRRVCYSRAHDAVVSCSLDSRISLSVRHRPGKIDDYVFSVARGVTCFHMIPKLQLFATGSPDGSVRLWTRGVSDPTATLVCSGRVAVVDVAVIADLEVVVAFLKNCWVDIFDLYEECLLQTIKIRFPFLGVLGKKVEFGAFCIHPGPVRKSAEEDSDSPTSFLEPRSSRHGSNIYNDFNEFKDPHTFHSSELIITCCDFTYTLQMTNDVTVSEVLPPPGGTRRARRPSAWDLNDDALDASAAPPLLSPRPIPLPASPIPAETQDFDLDVMLDNAGLQGILEKDFVLMMGFKNDLHKKLSDLQADMDTISSRVSIGAPYLACKLHDPTDIIFPET